MQRMRRLTARVNEAVRSAVARQDVTSNSRLKRARRRGETRRAEKENASQKVKRQKSSTARRPLCCGKNLRLTRTGIHSRLVMWRPDRHESSVGRVIGNRYRPTSESTSPGLPRCPWNAPPLRRIRESGAEQYCRANLRFAKPGDDHRADLFCFNCRPRNCAWPSVAPAHSLRSPSLGDSSAARATSSGRSTAPAPDRHGHLSRLRQGRP
jgi:hypothetical protein